MFYSNTLNLKQIGGGNQVKQGDFGSTFTYGLADEKGRELNIFDQKTAYVNLVLNSNIVFTKTVIVDGSTVTFNIDKAIPTGLYFLEIKIDSYIFPSDRQTIILVQAGSVAYDLKDLVPNYDTNMTISGILSDLSQKGIDISDLKNKMSTIYNNALADNAEIIQARGGQSSWDLSSNVLLVDSVDKTKAYLNINLLTNYSGVPSSGKFMEYITNSTSEKLGISFYISNGLFPTFAKIGTDLVITMPTSGGMYSRLFLNIKNTERILWPDGYAENAGKKLYQTTYTVPNATGLYWDTDTDSLQIAGITSAIPSSYILMAANINGYIAAGEFYKYKVNNAEKAISSIESVKNSPYTFINRQGELGGRPENSLEGVLYAKENGYDDIRVSVKFTADGIPVLFHDNTIGTKVKNKDGSDIAGTINFSTLTHAQLSSYDFGIYYGSQYKGLVCPKLEDFLELCAFKGINPTIEVKEETITEEQVLAILAPVLQYGLTDRTFISSHKTNVLDAFFEKLPNINFALITYPEKQHADKVLKYKHLSNKLRMDIFDYNETATDFLLYAKSNGILLKVGSCYNVEQIKTWMKKGVDNIEVAFVKNPKAVIFNEI